jgi:hypothetical protein
MSLNAIPIPAAREPGPLVTSCRSRTVAKVDSIGLVVRRWIQCWVVVGRQKHVDVFGDLRNRLGPLGAVVGLERFDGLQWVVAVLGVVDLGERGCRAGLCRLREGGKNVRDDVEPAPLLASVGEHLPQGLPKPQARDQTCLDFQITLGKVRVPFTSSGRGPSKSSDHCARADAPPTQRWSSTRRLACVRAIRVRPGRGRSGRRSTDPHRPSCLVSPAL